MNFFLRQCPITGSCKTKMTAASFAKLCRAKIEAGENGFCRECCRHPPELETADDACAKCKKPVCPFSAKPTQQTKKPKRHRQLGRVGRAPVLRVRTEKWGEMSLNELSAKESINRNTLYYRISVMGLTADEAISVRRGHI